MNAILALCHFCELHGPQILFCTQPNHPKEPSQDIIDQDVEGGGPQRVKSPSVSSSEPATPTSAGSTFKNDHCEGCYAAKPGFVSHDTDVHVSYVSSRHPHNREVFSMIRQACLRSLSGEVCPGREGPIFFGNDQQGHVLSYAFHVKDSEARGFHRKYSIIVVMMDKIYLLNSWPFLVPNLKIVVEHLQVKASKVYEREEGKRPPWEQTHLRGGITPGNYLQQRVGAKAARSLTELTDDPNIFKILHISFVWILKACGNRITESLLEGPPTEDSIIDMEKQEEIEDGFTLLFVKKKEDSELDGKCKVEEEEEEEETSDPPVKNIRHLMKILGNKKFHSLAHHAVIGNQVIVKGSQKSVVRSVIEALKILGNKKFHSLAHHAVIGNQVIVKGSQKSVVRSVIEALKSLVPKGCCRVVAYSKTYEESWKCNFLGLAQNVSIPNHVMSSEMFVLVEIASPCQEASMAPPSDAEILKESDFQLASPTTLPEKSPAVLGKMEMALKNDNLTEEVVEHYLICLKEEWMNKVKVLFKFTKAGGGRSDEDTKRLLQVVGAQDEDKQLLKFWMTGLSWQYRTHILSTTKSQH